MTTALTTTPAPLLPGRASRRRLGATLFSMLLTACGGSAKDRDTAPDLQDLGNRVPGVFEFPEGGRELGGVSGLTSTQFAPDRTGALWFVGCDGLFVLDDGQARFYDATISALPENMISVTVDANNRKWIIGDDGEGRTLGVFEQGELRPVLTSADRQMQIASAANGVVWASYLEGSPPAPVLRQVAPTLGQPLPVPSGSSTSADTDYSVSTDHDGALWLSVHVGGARSTGYRWADGAWSAPFPLGNLFLQYEAAQDVLWSLAGELDRDVRRVSWAGDSIQERFERGLEETPATLAGFGAEGRQIWVHDGDLLWVKDGVAVDQRELPGRVRSARASWDGAVYAFTDTTLHRLHQGELTDVLDLLEFSGSCR